jgi:hypothetical protein
MSADPDKRVSDGARHVAERLRRAATNIERRADELDGGQRYISLRDLAPAHGDLARDVIHEVATTFANMRLDELAQAAAEADVAVRRVDAAG